ncbi:MAG: hypothetical protein V4644_02920 [Patescibacteria group bacterium]
MFSLRAHNGRKAAADRKKLGQKPTGIDPSIMYGESPNGQFTFLFPHQ